MKTLGLLLVPAALASVSAAQLITPESQKVHPASPGLPPGALRFDGSGWAQ